MTNWTGSAPLTLAAQTGIFSDHGLRAELHVLSPSALRTGLADGTLNCAAASVDGVITWAGSGLPLHQVLVLDQSAGGHALAAKPGIRHLADLHTATIAVDAPGTVDHFFLASVMQQASLSLQPLKTQVMDAAAAAKAFLAGQVDACVTYEPFLSPVRDLDANQSHLLATSRDIPILGTLAVTPDLLLHSRETVAELIRAWFTATDMMQLEPDHSFRVMGAPVDQDAGAFAVSAGYVTWLGRQANRDFAQNGFSDVMAAAAQVLTKAGTIAKPPALTALWTPI